jgi:hypothetical protein
VKAKEKLLVKSSVGGMVIATVWIVLHAKWGTDVQAEWGAIWFASWWLLHWLLSDNADD